MRIIGEVTKLQEFDNFFKIIHVKTDDGNKVITGKAYDLVKGMTLTCDVKEKIHPTYGLQYEIVRVTHVGFASNKTSLLGYLSSKAFGISKQTAQKLLNIFGSDVINILTAEPDRLLEIKELDKDEVNKLINVWHKRKEDNQVLSFLTEDGGLAYQLALQIQKEIIDKHGFLTVQKNPYLIMEIETLKFDFVDEFALKIGYPRTGKERVCACLKEYLETSALSGNVYLDGMTLMRYGTAKLEITFNEVKDGFFEGCKAGFFVFEKENKRAYLSHIFFAEKQIADIVKAKIAMWRPVYNTMEEFEQGLQKLQLNHPPSAKQKEAIFNGIARGISVITGSAGTGKSSTVDALVKVLKLNNLSFNLCSPTGKAANRLSEVTGEEASTIHRLFGFDAFTQQFTVDANAPIDSKYIIVDEFSMVDTLVFRDLLNGVSKDTHVILLGDYNQLPAIGPGALLKDFIQSGKVHTTELDLIFRQEKKNNIVTVATDILKGVVNIPKMNEEKADCVRIVANTPKSCIEAVISLSKRFADLDIPTTDIQFLAPVYKGECGIDALNKHMQTALNDYNNQIEMTFGHMKYRLGDKVIQTKNDYDNDVYNGDIGFITQILGKKMYVQFMNKANAVEYQADKLQNLKLAYTISTHKSQGSEFGYVGIVMHDEYSNMLQRNLLYTAITRAKKKCFLIGTQTALQKAADNIANNIRNTTMQEYLTLE